jgi:hypothetical protein
MDDTWPLSLIKQGVWGKNKQVTAARFKDHVLSTRSQPHGLFLSTNTFLIPLTFRY